MIPRGVHKLLTGTPCVRLVHPVFSLQSSVLLTKKNKFLYSPRPSPTLSSFIRFSRPPAFRLLIPNNSISISTLSRSEHEGENIEGEAYRLHKFTPNKVGGWRSSFPFLISTCERFFHYHCVRLKSPRSPN